MIQRAIVAFSSRLNWDMEPNRLSVLLAEKRRLGAPLLDLTESNPTRAGLHYPPDILDAFQDSRALIYDPAPAGSPEARAAVASYYESRGTIVDPGSIFLTASTSESYSWLFKLLADPGDEILAPQPSYPLFEFLAALESVRVAHYPLTYSGGWWIDIESLRRGITDRTRAVIVVHPNNPTGSFVGKDELHALTGLCAEHDLAIISDEVFADYAFHSDPSRASTLVRDSGVLTFSLGGLSKIAGLPQMKLGWIVAGGPAKLREAAVARLELIADTYLSVGTPVQLALPRLLNLEMHRQIAARAAANLNHLRSLIRPGSPCDLLKVEGGWYAILRTPCTRSDEEWCLALLYEDNVIVQPGFFYDFADDGFLILSLLTIPDLFHEGAERLLARVNSSAFDP